MRQAVACGRDRGRAAGGKEVVCRPVTPLGAPWLRGGGAPGRGAAPECARAPCAAIGGPLDRREQSRARTHPARAAPAAPPPPLARFPRKVVPSRCSPPGSPPLCAWLWPPPSPPPRPAPCPRPGAHFPAPSSGSTPRRATASSCPTRPTPPRVRTGGRANAGAGKPRPGLPWSLPRRRRACSCRFATDGPTPRAPPFTTPSPCPPWPPCVRGSLLACAAVFVHHTAIQGTGFRFLNEGEKVSAAVARSAGAVGPVLRLRPPPGPTPGRTAPRPRCLGRAHTGVRTRSAAPLDDLSPARRSSSSSSTPSAASRRPT